jgi:predicted protein tyrosine phosphatase
MNPQNISLITICGLDELKDHSMRGVSHVLSILDPSWPEPEAFWAYDPHHRTTLHFHDIIEPLAGCILPERGHVEAILAFGHSLARSPDSGDGHLLIHCHMGVSRSTAAMAMILAQAKPEIPEEEILSRLEQLRPQIWPNSLMIAYADELLGREGRLTEAVRHLYGRRLAAKPSIANYMRENARGREVDMAIPPA